MDIDLAELQRDIGKPVIEPVKFSVGCLSVLDCGSGYLKVSLKENELEPLAELLSPEQSKGLIQWLKNKFI